MAYAMPTTPVRPPAAANRRRTPLLLLLGAALLITGIVLWVLGSQRYRDAITSMAPAPAGCETSLEFDGDGMYTFFVETKGSLDAIDGDCTSSERDYDYDGDASPRVSLTLVDTGGDEVDLERVEGPSYDGGGRSGEAIRTAEIDEAGTYVLTVDANDPDVVVRVGQDPNAGVGVMRILGILAAIAGLGAIVLGLLRRRGRPALATPTGSAPQWQPGGGPPPVAPPPSSYPQAPPYRQPPAPGPYGPGQWGTPGPGGPPPPPPQPWPGQGPTEGRHPLPPPPGR